MRLIPVMWVLCGVIAVGGPLLAWRSYTAAKRSMDAEVGRLQSVRTKAEELQRLRTSARKPPASSGGEEGLATRVPQVLTRAGIPVASLASLAPQSESLALPGGQRAARQRATVALTPITLPQLGKFLSEWRTAEPGWNVSSIDVAPEVSAAATPGADLPLRVNMTIESLTAEAVRGTS